LRNLTTALLDRCRTLRDVLDEHRRRARRRERRLAAEHLVGDDTQRIEVAPSVDLTLPSRLLGRHVGRGPEGHSGRRQPGITPLGHRTGDSKVGDHRAPRFRIEDDVVRLDIAVNDAPFVGVGERVGHFSDDPAGLVHAEDASLV
jgi:hypothetical protein